jgi:ABC-type phosphate/phosphonate transport system permease subunit
MQMVNSDKESVRSTLTSDFYFSKEAVVDSYINAEFFKHLPGILTGVGIIGTFSGLIWGLRQFDSANAVETLNLLLGEVSSAFLGSGIAIFVAIFITFFEKQTLNRCYQQVEELTKLLDSLYKAGVGEDYLARLVKATEISAANSANLKNVLIENLEILMTKQSAIIGETISKSLEQPINKLMTIVEKASGDQSGVIKSLVESLMGTFITKIDEAFGTQIEAVNQAIYRSTATMESVEGSMRRLLDDIAMASQQAVKSMSEQMLETVIQANINQDQKNQLLRDVVADLHQMNQEHQVKSQATIEQTMSKVLHSFEQSLGQFASARELQNTQDETRNSSLMQATKEIHQQMQLMLDKSLQDQHQLNLQLKNFVEEVNQITYDQQVKSKEVIDQTLQQVIGSVDHSIAELASVREQQNRQDVARNDQLIASTKELHQGMGEVLKSAMQDQHQLSLQLKTFVEELNQLTFDQQVKSKEVIDQTLQRIVGSVDQSIAQLAVVREQQNLQDEVRNSQLVASTKELHQGMGEVLQSAMQDQHQLSLQLKSFVEELNQLTFDQQVKSKEVIDQTLQRIIGSVDQSIAQLAIVREQQNLQDQTRNNQLVASTRELHQNMGEVLQSAMQDQHQLSLQLKTFVEDLNQMSYDHQVKTKDMMVESTNTVLKQLEISMNQIASDRQEQIKDDEQRAIALTGATQEFHNGIANQVKELISEMNGVINQSNTHIHAIEKVSLTAIENMNLGAQKMHQAADQFTSAGEVVVQAFEQSKTITEQMENVGQRLQSMMINIQDLFKQFEQSSFAHQDYMKELTQLIAIAKKESGVSAEILAGMERSLSTLKLVENTSTEYLGQVNNVLKEAFSQFNLQMMAQVTGLNQENDRLLGSAVGALTSAVEQIVISATKLRSN